MVESHHWLTGGGEMGERMRAFDWARTPLGPVARWPQSLRSAVSFLLPSKAQIILFWGPELVTLYNDAYRPVFGAKHPRALGLPAREAWSEVWDVLGPLLGGVVALGEAFHAEDHPFFLERHGFTEETYFDVSYDPVRDESGAVGGVFCIVTETTGRVLGERRLRTLRQIGGASRGGETAELACRNAIDAIATNPADLPYALLYLIEGDRARLMGSSGGEALDDARELDMDPDDPRTAVLARVRLTGTAGEAALATLLRRPPDSAAERMLVLPITSGIRVLGLLVAGVSRLLPLNDAYRDFFDLVAAAISTEVSVARALEEERRRAEALAELDRAKTAFFSNVSHEFRTPLTLLLGPIEEALADTASPLPPIQRERHVVAHRNALRLLRLVNTLLDFSRIEAGRSDAIYVPMDLALLTAELTSVFRSAIEKAGVKLRVECSSLPELVYVDRDMWEKIVLNLVSNAFKFTFDGEIAVTIRAAGGHAELTVRDTGIGIADHELPHIFERFHRVRDAQGRTHEGTGIGLALVQDLVKLHGGAISVASEAGRGTAFTVAIPFGAAHLPAERIGATPKHGSTALSRGSYVEDALRWLPDRVDGAESERADREAADGTPRARILLADDNADMRDYVRGLLQRHWTVEAVGDGGAALAAARARRPDLVLADVMMPRLDGFGLLRALRGEPGLRALPVILVSARAGEESRVEGLEAGADDYLVKPFAARELIARVHAHLTLAQERSEALAREEAGREEAERANRAKDEFLAVLSHELRTPLTAMLGWVRLLRGGRLDGAATQRALEVIERNVTLQSRLISDLLDISRIVAGKLTLERAGVDLAAIVSGVVETFRPTAEEKSIALTAELGPAAIPVDGDTERLRQVIVNLLSNALKFTPGGGRVTVALAPHGDHARLTVRDTGRGISPEFLPYIFERFRQADATSTRAQAGLGIGLTIARHVVELHGGRIHAESPGEGQGTVFTVELPLAGSATAAPGTEAGARHPGRARALDGVRVLVVDDSPDTRDLFVAILREQDADVTAVESTRDALVAARRVRPHVVLCDLAMPGGDGFAFIRELRTRPAEDGGAAPAVAVTAYARGEDRDRALAAGFQLHLSKPVDPAELISAVVGLASAPA